MNTTSSTYSLTSKESPMSDTPVGRARDAAKWQFLHDESMSEERHGYVSAHRFGFKYGAAWSRTDALTPPSEDEVETAARALAQLTNERVWGLLPVYTRQMHMDTARAVLSSFLTGRRAEG